MAQRLENSSMFPGPTSIFLVQANRELHLYLGRSYEANEYVGQFNVKLALLLKERLASPGRKNRARRLE